MEVDLDPDVPLFRLLADLGERVQAKGRMARIVGGAAMLLWGRCFARSRDMTRDIDCALSTEDLYSEAAAARHASEWLGDLQELGFRRVDGWRESRTGRYSYVHSKEKVAIELLCGSLPVGRASRRSPAWQIASALGGPPHFYAARVPWLDFVDCWVQVRITCGRKEVEVCVPDLPGLAVLKLRAVVDKIRRVAESQDDAQSLSYESLRLERHAQDWMLLLEWIDERGEFDRLVKLATQHPELPTAAREAARWTLEDTGRATELGLDHLRRSLERIAP